MPHFPPPPPRPRQVRTFQRVPPAVFSPILGLFGLGVAWRFGAGAFGLPRGVVELYLGAVTLLFLFALAAYGAKVVQRPGVVADDMRVLPGHAGLAAMTMSTMLCASVIVPYWPGLAWIILVAGFGGHMAVAMATLAHLIIAERETRQITPVLHIVFVGFIVSPAATIPMALDAWVPALVWYSMVATLGLSPLTLPGLLMGRTPAPLRPLHAIHLAPPALTSGAAILVGLDLLGLIMLGWAGGLFLLLLVRLPWLIEAGFSGFWSAFTFPIAAFAGALFAVHISFDLEAARIAGGLVLVAATLIILPIGLQILRLWADGTLATKTNAATA